MNTQQLELTMNKDRIRNVRHERQSRARWWFARMRDVVNLAMPAQPMVNARPEQTYLQLQ